MEAVISSEMEGYHQAHFARHTSMMQVDIVVLASRLATIGYRVALRTAVGGGTGQDCFRNLCYQFLLVSDSSAHVQHVVDPKFRSFIHSI